MTPLLVLLLVSAGEASNPLTIAMRQQAAEALGARGRLIVEEVAADTAHATAVLRQEALGAYAVARVTWLGGSPPRVELWVHKREDGAGEGITRVLGFDSTDPPAEIGRAAAYAMLAMLPAAREALASPGPRAPPPAAPPAAPEPTDTPTLAAEQKRRLSSETGYLFVDVTGAASAGVGGHGGGLGGGLRLGWVAGRHLRLSAGLVGRVGDVPPAQATASTFAANAGGALVLPVAGRVAVALRADAFAQLQAVTHFMTGTDTTLRTRWLPGVDAAGEVAVWVAPSVALVGAAGLELAAGQTQLLLGDATVPAAVIPRARVTAELGLRLRL